MASPYDAKHEAIRAKIENYAQKFGINPKIAVWQIWQESRFNTKAVSPAGAKGIAQFMPATAKRFGVSVFDVDSSLNGWGKYMTYLLKLFNGNYEFALAGYNAGEGNVKKHKGIPPFQETRNYVKTIMQNAKVEQKAFRVNDTKNEADYTFFYFLIAAAAGLVLIGDK